jgi:glutamyl-tRNA synthetase
MAEAGTFYFAEEVEYDEKAAGKFLTVDKAELFESLMEGLSTVEPFTEAEVEGVFTGILDARGIKLGKLAQPVRVALTGGTVSPGIFETIAALGREKTLGRLKKALTRIRESA